MLVAVLASVVVLSPWQRLISKGLGLETLSGFYHDDVYHALGIVTYLSSKLQTVRALEVFYLLPSLGLRLIPLAALLDALGRESREISVDPLLG